ncbi:creatininase family protein [Rhodococcus sp. NPDC004095]
MTRVPLLAHLPTTRIDDLDRENAVVVQPIGAVEQHGPHLPVGTDALLAEYIAREGASRSTAPAWVLPTLSYGTSNEHLGWTGTVSLDTATLLAVGRDIARSVHASGFTRLVFVNGHGGQTHLLSMLARDIRVEFGLQVVNVMPGQLGVPEDVTVADAEWGIHAGELETSMMMHVAPDLVDLEAAVVGGMSAHELFTASTLLTIENGISPAWTTDDISPENGVIGDPRRSSAELGRAVVEHQIDRLADALTEISTFAFPTPRSRGL